METWAPCLRRSPKTLKTRWFCQLFIHFSGKTHGFRCAHMQNTRQFETNGQSDKATKQNLSKICDVDKKCPPCKAMKIANSWLQTGSTKALAEARSTWGKAILSSSCQHSQDAFYHVRLCFEHSRDYRESDRALCAFLQAPLQEFCRVIDKEHS